MRAPRNPCGISAWVDAIREVVARRAAAACYVCPLRVTLVNTGQRPGHLLILRALGDVEVLLHMIGMWGLRQYQPELSRCHCQQVWARSVLPKQKEP